VSNVVPVGPSFEASKVDGFWQRAQRYPLRPLTLPDGFSNLKIEGIKNRFVREIIADYGKDFFHEANKGIGPFLTGQSGAYKTYGAAVLGQAIYDRFQITVDFFDCASEFPKIDRLWYEGYAQQRMEQLHKSPVVIIDDFSVLRTGTRDLITFQEIVNVRYTSRLPTILTANIILDTGGTQPFLPLETLVGVATARRIIERSKGFTASIH